MTKKILVPLLVAPLILSGCGNGKKALKPFERGDNLITAELVKAVVGEAEEVKLTISEEKFTAPDGWKNPEFMPEAMAAGFDVWVTTDDESIDTYHIVSLLVNKEVASIKDDTSLIQSGFEVFTEFDLDFGYCYAVTVTGEGDDAVYSYKAVDAFGNTIIDWSGKDPYEMPEVTDFVYVSNYSEFYMLEYAQYKDFHVTKSYKLYAEDFLSLEDIVYLPESGEAIAYIDWEIEKDGKTYIVDIDSNARVFNEYEVNEKGNKLVKSFKIPENVMFSGLAEDTYIFITDEVVAKDSEEFTYVSDLPITKYVADDYFTDPAEQYYVPGFEEKRLQTVYIFDFYNLTEDVVKSEKCIGDFESLGLEELELDEEVLEDPYLFYVDFYDLDATYHVVENYHSFIADRDFGIHDELFMPQTLALYGYLTPFGDGYLDSFSTIVFGEDITIYDENLNVKAQINADYFALSGIMGDYMIVSTYDMDEAELYAIVDADGKLVTGFEFSDITPYDDTHAIVYDAFDAGMGLLDLSSGSVKWVDASKCSTDGLFTYLQKGEGDNIKYDAYFGAIFYKEVDSNDLAAAAIYEVYTPDGKKMKVGVPSLREGTTDVYDIVWYVFSGLDYLF